MKINLECIDTYFCIKKKDTKISVSTIEKVSKAWSEGHRIVLIIHKYYLSGRMLEIRTVNNTNQIGEDDLDITLKWKFYAKTLIEGQFPADWEHLI